MCQQIIQFCSGSTKPLVFAGSFLTLLLAIGLGYIACSANALYQDIDPALAQSRSLTYHLQLVASAYLILISVLACFAAHYDQKHSIRVLAALTSLNFLLAVAAILMIPQGSSNEIGSSRVRLEDAILTYDFKLKPEVPPALQLANDFNQTAQAAAVGAQPTGAGSEANKAKQRRMAGPDGAATDGQAAESAPSSSPMNATVATKLWDNLQARGCCGLKNSTDWKNGLPKSCCSSWIKEKDEFHCNSVDEKHNQPCIKVIESLSINTKNMGLLLVLALIALVNLYLANVTGISAYRTFHYNEASQNAYS